MTKTEFSRRQFLWSAGATGAALATGCSSSMVSETTILMAHPEVIKELNVLKQIPFNGEPALAALRQSWQTPHEQLYIRNHAPAPVVTPERHVLRVEGNVRRELEIPFNDLVNDYRRSHVEATMTCAGNRRTLHNQVKPVGGIQWGEGAIGTVKWTGTSLGAILKKAGVKDGQHVWFEGGDRIEKDREYFPFGGSVPIEKVMDDTDVTPGVLLAYEMNGKVLTANHGFPLRTVVPGYIGARSVKWLRKIVVSDRPSPNHYLQNAYKLVVEGTEAEWAAADPIYHYPINSVITSHTPGQAVPAGSTTVKGYALPPGLETSRIGKVEVSADGGQNWQDADLVGPEKAYCWRFWEAQVDVQPGIQVLMARAYDEQGRMQPIQSPWNLKGYLYNAWPKIAVNAT